MKDKDKQIEETMYELYSVLREHLYKKESEIAAKLIAEYLIKNGWVKLREDSIVLSKEKYEEYKQFQTFLDEYEFENVQDMEDTLIVCQKLLYERIKRAHNKGSKEAAEKFVNETIKRKQTLMNPYTDDESECVSTYWIYKLAKQLGVEIKEN